jgi:hypothetical protein
MTVRRGSVWMGALVACVPVALAGNALAAQGLAQPKTDENCEEAGVVHFGVDSAKLNTEAKRSLDQVAEQLRDNDDSSARIEAFTDPSGKAERNLALSEKRALAVETYLRDLGVPPERLQSQGRGEAATDEAPKAPTQERVAVVTTCEPEAAPAAAETPPAAETPEAPPAPPSEVATPEPEPVEPLPPPSSPPATFSDQGLHGRAAEPRPMSGFGMALTAGAGITDYTQQRARDVTDAGVTWDVRLTLGTRTWVGLDLAYVGSAQSLNVAGLSTDSYLLGNGGEAALRIQYPYGFVRPYLLGGIGWQHLSVERADALTVGLLDADNLGIIPFGAGLALGKVNGFVLDILGTGRVAFDDDLLSRVTASSPDSAHMLSWGVTARLGGEF